MQKKMLKHCGNEGKDKEGMCVVGENHALRKVWKLVSKDELKSNTGLFHLLEKRVIEQSKL
jgi:hypothetical protein